MTNEEIEEAAKAYAYSIVPNPDKYDAPYYTTRDRFDDLEEAFEAGVKWHEGFNKNKTTKAFGLSVGSIHEGGGWGNIIYTDIELARKKLHEIVLEENQRLEKTILRQSESDKELYEFELYAERKPDYFVSNHDYITIQEFELRS